MADTIVNTPGPSNNGDSSAGWLVALVIIVVVVAGGVFLYQRGVFSGGTDTTNINVTVPDAITPAPETPTP